MYPDLLEMTLRMDMRRLVGGLRRARFLLEVLDRSGPSNDVLRPEDTCRRRMRLTAVVRVNVVVTVVVRADIVVKRLEACSLQRTAGSR